MTYSVFTHLERPDLAERAAQAGDEVWPEYNRHGDVTNAFWRRMRLEFAGLQFVLYDEERDDLVAEGHTIAISWDGTQEDLPAGFDGIFERGFADGPKTALCAMAAEIWPAHQGAGLASELLELMSRVAARRKEPSRATASSATRWRISIPAHQSPAMNAVTTATRSTAVPRGGITGS